jgi:sulfite reductase beta subunit-like hemoprotein
MESALEIPTEDLMRFADRFSLGRDRGLGSKHFLRIKVPAGALTSEQFHAIAQMADDYSKGYAEITDRQDIQLHWILGKDAPEVFTRLDELGFTTDKCGQAFPGARYGDVRNVVVCPLAGVNKNELINVVPIAEKINDFFIGNRDFLDMPRKFKFSITACEIGCTRPEMQDLGFFAVKRGEEIGFAALIGGALGPSQPGPRLARPLGVFIRPEEVFEVAKVTAEIHRDYGNRESKPKARFKWLVEAWGVEKIREKIEEKLGRELERFEHGYLKVSGEEHVGVQEQKNGKFSITVPLIGGLLSSNLMRKIAGIADELGGGEIRTTPYQNFVITNIPQEKLDETLRRLGEIGLRAKGPMLRWTTIGCAADFCGKSVEPHPKQMAKDIVEHLEERFGETMNDLKLFIHVTGCPNDCGLYAIGHIGLLGVKMKGDGIEQRYNLSAGGGAGTEVFPSKLVKRMARPGEVKLVIEKLVAACIKEGFKDFGEFCRTHELEELKSIVTMR